MFCRKQTVLIAFSIAVAALQDAGLEAAPAADDTAVSGEKLLLKIIDPNGQPVIGAKVGTGLNVFENSQGHPPQTIIMWLRGQKRSWPFCSDARGEVVLTGLDTGYQHFYVSYPARGLVGYHQLPEDSASDREIVRLEPACRIHGRLTCSRFDALGHPMSKTVAFLYDSRDRLMMYFVSERGRYEFLLPSGRYELECVGEGPSGIETQRRRTSLDIEEGQRALDLGSVDLQSTRLAELFDKPAPALDSVASWRGPKPRSLRVLRGNVVVLVFWGSWSRPCLKTMPQLIELHDLYYDKGLSVIAVHDNSLAAVQELETKLIEARSLYWARRDLPFAVGIDSGPGRGATHEDYGIDQWPTTIVIDREGKVAGKLSPWGPLQKELPRLLNEP
ncbi:MAG: TlpA disulfide reductase family protein [Planctomycetota bacterium]|jgi:thiol-disulfide isomerase/thioredoxin